MVKLNMNIKFL